jgi:hypothetical protein
MAHLQSSVQRQETETEPIKVTLCEHCSECPEVEITDQGVTIGEDENTVRLSHAEWNELVRLVCGPFLSSDYLALPGSGSLKSRIYRCGNGSARPLRRRT